MPRVKKDQAITTSSSRNVFLLLLLFLALSSARPLINQENPAGTLFSKRAFLTATKEAFGSTHIVEDTGQAGAGAKYAKGSHAHPTAHLGPPERNTQLKNDAKELSLAPETHPSTANGKTIFGDKVPLDLKPAQVKPDHSTRIWKENADKPTPYNSEVIAERNPNDLGGR